MKKLHSIQIHFLWLPLVIAMFALVSCAGPTATGKNGERGFTVLSMNDTYRIEGVADGTLGGISRVRTLRRDLEQRHGDILIVHAGDILYPSLLSRRYKGAQMVDVLNRLDGDAGRFDQHMFVIFGNHEFDKSRMKHAPGLHKRLLDSGFTWLNANVQFGRDSKQRPLLTTPNHLASKLIEFHGVKVGLFGLTSDVKIPEYVEKIHDPLEIARNTTAALRQQGAEVVIAVTHLDVSIDAKLLETLGDAGPDLIFGGHEHFNQIRNIDGRPRIFKADADAVTVFVTEIALDPTGAVNTRPRLVHLDHTIAQDTQIQERVEYWRQRYDREYCADSGATPACLDTELGNTRVPLVAEELTIRSRESNLGSWIADRALQAFADQGAQVAFVNSGSLRLNYNLPPGPITQRHIAELFAYPSPMHLIRIDGKTLKQVAQRSVSEWPGQGRWLQVAGFAFRHHTVQQRADRVTLLTANGPRPVKDSDSILAVVSNFLIDPAIGDQDGYTMLDKTQIVDIGQAPPDLKVLTMNALQAAGSTGIAPQEAGRICNVPSERPEPCLIVDR